MNRSATWKVVTVGVAMTGLGLVGAGTAAAATAAPEPAAVTSSMPMSFDWPHADIDFDAPGHIVAMDDDTYWDDTPWDDTPWDD
ncbi:hypothetical protein E4P42_21885 [Mycobacterium sp. PS03-16]|uniref:hypothetical protein n=1 Tax=Mycobacterium sp. PS03-16 TaxID=2559611 RepID=UPI00107342BD|nr:hypothetical protein [Mycobacterium sp. PS03-16]TFV55743.1 hypothetical protein E4P42_21885 [Mycobacterium sp. PS03-16]